jgi:hypothetical protein
MLTVMQDHFVDLTMHKTRSRTALYLMDRMVEFINGQPIWRFASSLIRKLKRNMDIIGDDRLASVVVVQILSFPSENRIATGSIAGVARRIIYFVEVRGHAAWESEPLVRSLQKNS